MFNTVERAKARGVLDFVVSAAKEDYERLVIKEPLKNMVKKHCQKTGINYYLMNNHVFLEAGEAYPVERVKLAGCNSILHESLQEEHAKVWALYQEFQIEQVQVTQTLRSILTRANEWQDVRDMFPDALLKPMLNQPGFAELKRARPSLSAGIPGSPEYDRNKQMLEKVWSPYLLEQYAKVNGIISMYLGYHFL